MKKVILTGATGFLGNYLLMELIKRDIFVYIVCRPNSKRMNRIKRLANTLLIELEMDHILELPGQISEPIDEFYHLAWEGGREDFCVQTANVMRTLNALEAANKVGCKKFICTGSQAEYGVHHQLITEETLPNPDTAYGAAKLAACILSRVRAAQLDMAWIWARVFSVYGPGDSPKSLIPYVIRSLYRDKKPLLTEGTHPWDYLYASDAAKALMILGEKGRQNEIYNVAFGESHSLRWYIQKLKNVINPAANLGFGLADKKIVPLEASIKKIVDHTGWYPAVGFLEGIENYVKEMGENEGFYEAEGS